MSMIPMGGNVVRPNPALVDSYPDYYLNMGLTAENLAKKYEITREQADEFSLGSHRKAAAAIESGKFKDEIVPVTVYVDELDDKGRARRKEIVFATDGDCRHHEVSALLGGTGGDVSLRRRNAFANARRASRRSGSARCPTSRRFPPR